MGGGDLNMKKSWHTGLSSNMEKVWLKEKAAIEERKKMAELRKEQEQERAVQELQRLQQEAGGAKREQRVEWMYAAPAEGNGPNAEELEAYLLGKKRVDKLLKGNEEMLMAAPSTATSGSFTSLQNANSARDTAAKIREDPLLFIKRQEQASYEKILKNPKRLKELRAAREAGLTPASLSYGGGSGQVVKKAKKDETKEERRIRKEGKRDREESRNGGSSSHHDGDHKRSRREDEDRYGSSSRRSRSRSPPPHSRSSRYEDDNRRDSRDSRDNRDSRDTRDSRDSRGGRSYNDDNNRRNDDRRYDNNNDRPSTSNSSAYHNRQEPQHRSRSRSRSPLPLPRKQRSSSPVQRNRSPPRHNNNHNNSNNNNNNSTYIKSEPSEPYRRALPPPAKPTLEQEAALKALAQSRLEAMQSSAASLSSSRNARLTALELEDSLVLKKEEEVREKSRVGKVGPSFLRDSEKKVFSGGMDLGERMKRSGRVGMVGDRD